MNNCISKLYEKHKVKDRIRPGDIVCADASSGKCRKMRDVSDFKLVIGVCTENDSDNVCFGDMIIDLNSYVNVGLCGMTYVNVSDPSILPGDLLKSDNKSKAVKAYATRDMGCIIGKALRSPKDGKVLMQIMLK